MTLVDNVFINNTSYSAFGNSHGGAISITEATGYCINCTFYNNTVNSFSSKYLISKMEPRSLGGAVRLNQTKFYFSNCTFINNTGFGISTKNVSTGKGGAFYSITSNVKITNCIFENNILLNYGLSFNINCYIEGGACYFLDSSIDIF